MLRGRRHGTEVAFMLPYLAVPGSYPLTVGKDELVIMAFLESYCTGLLKSSNYEVG